MNASILLLLLASSSPAADVVARVDATTITRADVEERLRILAERGAGGVTPELALGGLVDEALLAAEARRQGLDRDPAVEEAIAAQRRRLLAEALAADVAAKAQPGDDMLRQLYHSTGDSIRLVLVKLGSREEAAAARARVEAGGDLAEEAKKGLDVALAKRAGDTGLVTRAQVDPALADEAFRAPPGALVGPVELKLGWAIARVVERSIADEAGFAARRESLAAFARRQIAEQSRRHLVEQLRARNPVTVDEAFLRSLGNRTDATREELDRVIATVNGRPLRYRTLHATVAQLSGGGGHLAGPSTKVALAGKAVDELLLEAAALDRKLDAAPAVARVLPGIERNILASTVVARTAADPAAGTSDARVGARLGELKARAKIQIDETRLASLAAARR